MGGHRGSSCLVTATGRKTGIATCLSQSLLCLCLCRNRLDLEDRAWQLIDLRLNCSRDSQGSEGASYDSAWKGKELQNGYHGVTIAASLRSTYWLRAYNCLSACVCAHACEWSEMAICKHVDSLVLPHQSYVAREPEPPRVGVLERTR